MRKKLTLLEAKATRQGLLFAHRSTNRADCLPSLPPLRLSCLTWLHSILHLDGPLDLFCFTDSATNKARMAGIERLEIHSKVFYAPFSPSETRDPHVPWTNPFSPPVVHCALGQGRRGPHHLLERPAAQEVHVRPVPPPTRLSQSILTSPLCPLATLASSGTLAPAAPT